MSKEQTPITAEEFLKEHHCQNIGLRIDKYHRPDMYTSDMMEQYAQYREKKALEREFSKLDYVSCIDGEMAGINYYETEVKPEYE